MPRAVTVVMLDAGGVLFNNLREDSAFFSELAGRFDVPLPELLSAYERMERDYEVGRRDVREVIEDALRLAGAPASMVLPRSWLDELYLRCIVANEDVFSIARRLRSRPALETVLANNEARHWDEVRNARFGHFGLFDHLACSWLIEAQKPEREFFRRATERCAARPEEVLFVDDSEEVMAAARDFGFRAVRFTDAATLETDLCAAGVLPTSRGEGG